MKKGLLARKILRRRLERQRRMDQIALNRRAMGQAQAAAIYRWKVETSWWTEEKLSNFIRVTWWNCRQCGAPNNFSSLSLRCGACGQMNLSNSR